MRLSAVTALLIVNILTLPVGAMSAIRFVATTGSDAGNDCQSSITPCGTIQYAFDQAGNNDSISIMQGSYVENIVLDRPLTGVTVRGGFTCGGAGICVHDPNPALTVIDGNGAGRVLHLQQTWTGVIRFEHLTFQNGSGDCCGGGISVDSGVNSSSTVTIVNSVIKDNEAVFEGGGLAVMGNNVALEILDSAVTGNSAQSGGGLYATCNSGASGGGVRLVLKGTSIQNNTATGSGGGVYLQNSTTDCILSVAADANIIGTTDVLFPQTNPAPNTAQRGGGISAISHSGGIIQVTGRDNAINANSAQYEGALDLWANFDGTLRFSLENGFLTNNTATGGRGIGTVLAEGGSLVDLRIAGVTAYQNTGPATGGLNVFGWGGSQINLDFDRNWFFWNGTGGTEGVLTLEAQGAGTKITAGMRGNSLSANAQGIDILSQDSAVIDVVMENTYLVEHAADDGIYLFGNDGLVQFRSLNNTFANNGTDGGKGGIAVSSSSGGFAWAHLVNTIVWGNGIDITHGENDAGGDSTTLVSVDYSDFFSRLGATGSYIDLGTNISDDPLFLAGYELDPSSPAADAGICDEPAPPPDDPVRIAPLVDFEGDPRPPPVELAFLCDMGADEVDHCIDDTQNLDETGVDCGGNRCAPCDCTEDHVRVYYVQGGLWGINIQNLITATSGLDQEAEINAHRMEFPGVHELTNTSTDGGAINVQISGGWNCLYSARGPGDHTTIHGALIIGGDMTVEVDRLAVR